MTHDFERVFGPRLVTCNGFLKHGHVDGIATNEVTMSDCLGRILKVQENSSGGLDLLRKTETALPSYVFVY